MPRVSFSRASGASGDGILARIPVLHGGEAGEQIGKVAVMHPEHDFFKYRWR